jgi:CHAD domain-containing protein
LVSAARSRPQPQRVVWHDSADAALTALGLALAQERGTWRLEKLTRGLADIWSPGAPPPVLARSDALDALAYDLPQPLAPVVACIGRRHTLVAQTDQGPVTITLLRGAVRAVTAEHAFCRLQLSGDDPAVRLLSLSLAAALPLEVAGSTLGAASLAAARGTSPAAPGHGLPELPDHLPVVDAFAFVLGHLTDVLLHFAPLAAADADGPEPVHQMRVALRRLRSAMTVFRPLPDGAEPQALKAGLKLLNAQLGPVRDWDVFVSETLPNVQAAFPGDARLARLIAAAGRRRQDHHAALRAFLCGPEFRRLGIELAWLAGAHCWRPATVDPGTGDEPGQSVPLRGFAAGVLDRRLRKLLGTDDVGALGAGELHAVRLKAKRTRYAAEIFAPIFTGKGPHRFIRRLAALQNLLGSLNDGVTAHRLLDELGGAGGRHAYAAGLVTGFVAAKSAALLPKLARRWSRLQRVREFWG